MTKHLVSQLTHAQKAHLVAEVVDRLKLAEAGIEVFAKDLDIDRDAMDPHFINAVVNRCLSGLSFAVEEVQALKTRAPPRSRALQAHARSKST